MTTHSTISAATDVADGPVGALYWRLLTAWNTRDAAAFAALFAEDGNVVGFDGSQLDGRAAIEAELGRIFANHQTAPYTAKIKAVRSPAPGLAILRAVCGMVPPGQRELNPDLNSIQTMVAVQHGAEWRIELFQNTPAQFHGRPELAAQLTAELRQELERTQQH